MAEQTLVSVDLDDIACYHAIHGLAQPSERGVVLRKCLPRFLDLFDDLGVKATFFVIGHVAQEDPGCLADALAAGHELANHSHAHAYDFVRWSPEEIGDDLRQCDAVLRELGAEPMGFRAPGYTHSAAMLQQVRDVGYAYDASPLPSPVYYLAKLAAIGSLALRGRASRSVPDAPRSFLGPRTPYRHPVGLRILPISVTPRLRIPLIGTSLLSAPAPVAAALHRAAARLPYFHLELHGLDLADPDTDGYARSLIEVQPELRYSLNHKRDALHALLRARGKTTLLRDA